MSQTRRLRREAERGTDAKRKRRGGSDRRREREVQRERDAAREVQIERERERETQRAGREREKQRERELRTRAMKAKCWSSCCALAILRERATVAFHVEIDLHEHANGCRQRRASSASSTTHSSNIRARLHKTRACDNTGYTITNKTYKVKVGTDYIVRRSVGRASAAFMK